MSPLAFCLAAALILAAAPAIANDAGASPDGGGMAQDLAEIERSRRELETLTKQVAEQRALLERQAQEAQARQRRIYFGAAAAALVALLVALLGPRRWRRKKSRPG